MSGELVNNSDFINQTQKFWSPRFTKELRESLLLGSLVNKDYEGEIKQGGDEVTVSQINAPKGELLTIGTDADSFKAGKATTSYIKIKANKRAVAAHKFADTVKLQTMIDEGNPEIEASLRYAIAQQINDYLYSLVSPSTASPDHVISDCSDFNAAQLISLRKLASQAHWGKDNRYILVDPSYYADLLAAQTLVSGDYVQDAPVVGGEIGQKRFGFTIFEDDSRATDFGLVFHPDFMHLVMQPQVQVKFSDLHVLGQFGVLMSVDVIFGAALGINGDVKHIKVTAA